MPLGTCIPLVKSIPVVKAYQKISTKKWHKSTEDSDALGMNTWVILLDEELRPAKVLAEEQESRRQVVKEGHKNHT